MCGFNGIVKEMKDDKFQPKETLKTKGGDYYQIFNEKTIYVYATNNTDKTFEVDNNDKILNYVLELKWTYDNNNICLCNKKNKPNRNTNSTTLYEEVMRINLGNEQVESFKNEGFVIDHINNDRLNCKYDNLQFILDEDNKRKKIKNIETPYSLVVKKYKNQYIMLILEINKREIYFKYSTYENFISDYNKIKDNLSYEEMTKAVNELINNCNGSWLMEDELDKCNLKNRFKELENNCDIDIAENNKIVITPRNNNSTIVEKDLKYKPVINLQYLRKFNFID